MTDQVPSESGLPALPECRLLRVLLVDNDPAAAARSVAGLQSCFGDRVAIECADTLGQALQTLLAAMVDVIVLDLDVRDAEGLAAVAGLRSAAPLAPLVLYTGSYTEDLALRALRAGAQECLDKRETPPASLARVVTHALERHRRLLALEAARVEAAHRATHDVLTGLANRALFLDQLERALAYGARYQRKTGLLFLDLDGFKEVNDTHGHALGDTLLRTVARRLQESVRRSDAVARLGGDEFVVLLPEVTSRRDVAHVRDTMLAALGEPVLGPHGEPLLVEASIGSAMSPLDGATAHDLLAAADADMYREKELRRRDRLVLSGAGSLAIGPDLAPDARDSFSHRRESRLRAGMARGEFEVFYQPIVDVVADRITGAEALLRWRDPDRGLLSPSGFLGLAEDTGLIVPIGEQVLREACAALVAWRGLGADAELRVSVNLSAVQLREHGFEGRVAEILEETGCPPAALILELTENSTVVDGELALETLRALKSLGVGLVVDDFGVGHASLTFLREAPVDGIKIDRRFVTQMLLDQRDQAIVSSMVRLARGLGLDVVAEGVESGDQAQRLARLQCVTQQGRHFSEAIPMDTMTRLLIEQSSVTYRSAATWGGPLREARGA